MRAHFLCRALERQLLRDRAIGCTACRASVREPRRTNSAPRGARVHEVRQVARDRADVGPWQGRRVCVVDKQLQRLGYQDGGGQPVQEDPARLEKVQDIQHQG